MLREVQREVNRNRPFQSRLHIDYSTNNHHSQLRSTEYPECCFMAILSCESRLDPELRKKLWSNTCESIHNNQKERAEDNSYPKSIDIMLRETARKSYPENVDSPMIAPRDYEVRQSGRALELQNRDYWIRPTDLSWHYPIVVTIRAMPFK